MALYISTGRISDMSEVKSGTTQSGKEWQRMTLTLEMPGYQGTFFKQVFFSHTLNIIYVIKGLS